MVLVPAASKTIGRLGIKVWPDARLFRGELRAKMREVESRQDPVSVGVRAAANELARDVKREIRLAQAQAKDIHVGIDVDDLKAQAAVMRESLEDAGNIAMRRNREAANEWWREFKTLNGKDGFTAKQLFQFKDHELRAAARKLREQSKLLRRAIPFKVEPDEASLEKTRSLFDGLFEREYTGKVKFSLEESRSWPRMVKDMEREFQKHSNYKFTVEPDRDATSGALNATVDAINAELRKRLYKAAKYEIRLKPEFDNSELETFRRDMQKMFQERVWADLNVKVHSDSALRDGSIDRAFDEIRAELRDRLMDVELGADFEIRPDMSEAELTAAAERLKRFKEKWDNTDLEFKLKMDDRPFLRERAKLAKRMRAKEWDNLNVRVKLDSAIDDGSVDEAIDKVRNALRHRAFNSELGADFTIHPDMSEWELRQADRRLREFKAKWDNTEIELGLSVDDSDQILDDLRVGLMRRKKDWNDLSVKMRANVEFDAGDADRAFNEIQGELRRRAMREHLGADFKIHPDMSDHELRAAARKLKRFKDKWDDTELEFQLSLDHSSRYVAGARLAFLARDRWVKLKPFVDSKTFLAAQQTLAALSGYRLARDLTTHLWDMVKNLDKAVPLFGAISSGLAAAAAGATQLVKHLFTVGGSLGHIVQMVGLVGPGFAVAGGMMVASFLVPLLKIKEHVASFDDDIKGLSKGMADSFWGVGLKPFERAWGVLYPEFRSNMEKLSAAAGWHFGRVAESFAAIVRPSLSRMFGYAADGLNELTKHTDAFATVVDILGRHGAQGFQRALGWLGRMTDRWAEWLSTAERTGRLQSMIDRGIKALGDLGRATKAFGQTLGGVYEVARNYGGAHLEQLADGLERWAEVTHSAGFQQGLSRVFDGMGAAWENFKSMSAASIRDMLNSWSSMIARSGPLMGRAAGRMLSGVATALSGSKLNNGFYAFFKGLDDGLAKLQGVWPKVSAGLGALLKFMGALGRGFSPVVGSVLETLARTAERLVDPLSRIVERIGPRFASTFSTLGNVASRFLQVLANLLDVVTRIPGSVELVVVAFAGFKVLTGVSALVRGVGAAFTAAVQGVTAWGAAITALRGGQGLTAAADAAVAAQAGITGVSGAAKAASGAFGALGKSMLGALANPYVLAATVAIGGLVAALKAAADAAEQDGRRLMQGADVAFRKFADNTKSATDTIKHELKKLKEETQYALSSGSPFAPGVSGKSNIAQDAMDYWNAGGFERFFRATVVGKVKGVAAWANDTFKAMSDLASVDPSRAIEGIQMLGDGFRDAGVKAADWLTQVDKQLDSMPELEASLSSYLDSIGAASDREGIHAAVLGQVNVKQLEYTAKLTEANEASTRFSETQRALTSYMDSQVSAFGLTADSAGSVVNAMNSLAPSILNVGDAVVDANGNAVQSLSEFTEGLKSQVDAFTQLGNNMTDLVAAGLPAQFLEQLAQLPQGADVMQMAVDAMRSGTDDGKRQFDELSNAAQSFIDAQNGMGASTESVFARMSATYTGGFDGMKQTIADAIPDMNARMSVLGAQTVDALIDAVQANGYMVTDAGGKLVLDLGNGMAVELANQKSNISNSVTDLLNGQSLILSNIANSNGVHTGVELAQGMSTGLLSAGGAGGSVVSAAQDVVSQVNTALVSADLSGATEVGRRLVNYVAQGVSEASLDVSGTMDGVMQTLVAEGVQSARSFTTVGRQIVTEIGNGVGESGPISTSIRARITAASSACESAASGFTSVGGAIVRNLNSGVTNASGSVSTTVSQAINSARNGAINGASVFMEVGRHVVARMRDGVTASVGVLVAGLNGVITVAAFSAATRAYVFVNVGRLFVVQLASGVWAGSSALSGAMSGVVSAARGAAYAAAGGTYSIGLMISYGIAGGIRAGSGAVVAAAASVVRSAVAAARAAGDIHSPSRKGMEIGAFLSEGMALGIESGVERAAAAARLVMVASLAAARQASIDAERLDGGLVGELTSGERRARIAHDVSDEVFGDVLVRVDPKSLSGASVNMIVDGRTVEGYFGEVADERIVAASRL